MKQINEIDIVKELEMLRKENAELKLMYEKDIADRKRVEEDLITSRTLFGDIITFLPDATLAIDKDKRIIIWNKAIEEMTGVPAAEMIGKGDYAYTIPFYGVARSQLMDIIFENKNDIELRYLNVKREGDSITAEVYCNALYNNKGAWVFAKASALHDSEGRIMGAIEIIRDITERKMAEEALRQSENRYKEIIELAVDGILLGSREGIIVGANTYMQNLSGRTLNELIGLHISALFDKDEIIKTPFRFDRLKNEEIVLTERNLLRPDGKRIPIEMHSKMMPDGTYQSIFRDITERKQAEKLSLDIIDKNPMSIQVVDLDGYTLKVNSAHTKLFGSVPPPDMSLFNDFQLAQKGFGEFLQRIKNGEVVTFPELYFNVHDVSVELPDVPTWISVVAFPIKDISGKPERFVFMHEDITKRKEAEDALRISEIKYRTFIENSTDIVFCVNEKGEYQFTNNVFASTFGKDPNYFTGKTFWDVYSQKDADIRQEINKKVFETGLTQPVEVTVPLPDKTLYFIGKCNPIKDHAGHVILNITHSIDITDRKRVEEALKASETKYRKLVENSPDAIVIYVEGKIVFVNNECVRLMAASSQKDLIGKWAVEFVHPDYRSVVIARMKKAATEGVVLPLMEERFVRLDGTEVDVEVEAMSIDFENKPAVQLIIRDITERKQAELIIKKQNVQLKELNSTKDKFFSIIAHDLRSPFQGFLGLTQLLADETSSFTLDELSTITKDIHKGANNLYNLLENLLTWSQIQKDTIDFSPSKIDILAAVKRNIEIVNQRAIQKGIKIVNNVSENQAIYADEKMIDAVLRNLLSNAVKFTNKGGEIIIASKENDENLLELNISDTGIGMSEELCDKLFKIDEKVGSRGTEGELSSGLGLLLCKEFISKNCGNIWVKSEENKGSTFHITLKKYE